MSDAATSQDVGGIAADRLRSFVERIERLLAEIKDLQADIKSIKAEAKGAGFDIATINAIIKLRAMDEADRKEREALLDLYKAALGMLEDTPLGQAAIDRLTKPQRPASSPQGPDRRPQSAPPQPSQDDADGSADASSVADAREMGGQAFRDQKPITANPYPARDARRAAWDEGWCQASGSDGMEIPEAWRRSKPQKPNGQNSPSGHGGEA